MKDRVIFAGMLRGGEWQVRNLLGEGENLLVTPIQLLTAYCALMNGGSLYRPQIAPADEFVPEVRSKLPVESSQRRGLIEGMRGAVVYGTAEKSGLSSLPIFIFGKTGTSTNCGLVCKWANGWSNYRRLWPTA